MKPIGILIGVLGAVLFVWHAVKVILNEESSQDFGTHHWLSLIGGLLILAGTAIYIFGRRSGKK